MDDKTTAALREVFEARFGNDSERLERNADGDYVHPAVNFCWVDGWLACYQHLAPMVEDAERYRWLRDQPIVLLQEFATLASGNWDKAIDAAREQEKKTC